MDIGSLPISGCRGIAMTPRNGFSRGSDRDEHLGGGAAALGCTVTAAVFHITPAIDLCGHSRRRPTRRFVLTDDAPAVSLALDVVLAHQIADCPDHQRAIASRRPESSDLQKLVGHVGNVPGRNGIGPDCFECERTEGACLTAQRSSSR